VGAFYLLNEPDWVHRHVETVEVVDELIVRRQVTIDLSLPWQPHAKVAHLGDSAVYFMPILPLRKIPAARTIDMRDEAGDALPLLTRTENAAISAEAMVCAARTMAGQSLPRPLERRLHRIAADDPSAARRAWEDPLNLSAGVRDRIRSSGNYRRFLRVVHSAVGSSLLWVGLEGRPGQRRVLKLTYEEEVGLETGWLGRMAMVLGWTGVKLRLELPHTRDASSYHFQLAAPEQLDVRAIGAQGILRDRDGEAIDPNIVISRPAGHYHAREVSAGVLEWMDVVLRVDRRGFVTTAMIASILIASLLTIFSTYSTDVASHEEVSAAVLLIGPAALTALAVDLRGRGLSARLLSGVRYAVITSASLSALGATTLAGFTPFGFDHHEMWMLLMSASWVVALVITTTFVLSVGRVADYLARRALRSP
jgi:hypothetical protein